MSATKKSAAQLLNRAVITAQHRQAVSEIGNIAELDGYAAARVLTGEWTWRQATEATATRRMELERGR